jgi:hypothetical protein
MFKKDTYYLSMPIQEISSASVYLLVDKLYDEVIRNSSDLHAIQLQIKVNDVFRSFSKVQVVNSSTREEVKIIFWFS